MVSTTNMKSWHGRLSALVAVTLLGQTGTLAGGTAFVWQGDGPTPGDWGTAANWDQNQIPDVDPFSQVVLPANPAGSTNIILNGDRAPFRLRLGATPYTISGPGTLSVGGDFLIVDAGAVTQEIHSDLQLVGSVPMQIGKDATLLLSGAVGESQGSQTLTKAGPGTLQLTGALNNTGGIDVQGGTLRTNTDSNLGPGNVPLRISNGAEVSFLSGFNTSRAILLSDGGVVTASNRVWFLHPFLGDGPLVLNGGQTFLTTASEHTGGTLIQSFTVTLNGAGSATGTGPVVVAPGGFLTGYGFVGGQVSVDAGGTLLLDSETNGDVQLTLGGLVLEPGGSYTIESFGDGDRHVAVAGETLINGGTLDLLPGDLEPQPGDEFTVLVSEQLSGTFDAVNFPDDGQNWFIEYDTTEGEIVVGVAAICPGDTDQDGDVDISDLALLLSQFGASGSGFGGDVDDDGDVDISDLAQLLAAFGTSCSG